jgi:hypothetical protein
LYPLICQELYPLIYQELHPIKMICYYKVFT